MQSDIADLARIPSGTSDESSFLPPDTIRIWSPSPDQLEQRLRDEIAKCLAAAFSSRQWIETPMPVGDDTDPHSARGILAGLTSDAQLLIAAPYNSNDDPGNCQVLGSVVGAVLSELLINDYGLREYGARVGDSLLAYIGLSPERHGTRLDKVTDSIFRCSTETSISKEIRLQSLANVMFAKWLELPSIRSTPFTFIRTRQAISSIRHLANKHSFVYCGRFDLNFRGQQQDRLVFKRQN